MMYTALLVMLISNSLSKSMNSSSDLETIKKRIKFVCKKGKILYTISQNYFEYLEKNKPDLLQGKIDFLHKFFRQKKLLKAWMTFIKKNLKFPQQNAVYMFLYGTYGGEICLASRTK